MTPGDSEITVERLGEIIELTLELAEEIPEEIGHQLEGLFVDPIIDWLFRSRFLLAGGSWGIPALVPPVPQAADELVREGEACASAGGSLLNLYLGKVQCFSPVGLLHRLRFEVAEA